MSIKALKPVSAARHLLRSLALGLTLSAVLGLGAGLPGAAVAQTATGAPDEMIKALSARVIEQIKTDKDIQAGNARRISEFVDSTIMPNVNFERMTSLAVGRGWRTATPDQKKKLIAEFRTLLVRTYSGALTQFKDQTVRVKPLRAAAGDTEVIVRYEMVPRRGAPRRLDYRLEKTAAGWRIYDVNIASLWLVESYRNQFSDELNAKGLEGLIASLENKNRQFEGGDKK